MALSDYTQLEYIESTGTQYIDTGYKHNTSKTKYSMEVSITSTPNTYNALFGARTEHDSNDAYYIGITNNTNHTTYTCIGGTKIDPISGFNINFNTKYKIDIDPTRGITVNNTLYSIIYKSSTTSSYNDYIFGFNTNNSINEKVNMKLYSFKIYNDTNLVRDFIPVKRKSDNVLGLYDKVNDVFYMNKGSGSFVAGPIKDNITNYHKLEYIESTGTQYIDTSILPRQNTRIEMKFNAVSFGTNAECCMFGGEDGYNNNAFHLYSTNGEFDIGFSNQGFFGNYNASVDYTLSMKNAELKLNNNTYTNLSGNINTSNTIYLFALHRATVITDPTCIKRLYYCKLYNSDELVRDYIPVKRKSDNVVGLYDIVDDVFYTNKGTGNFIAGPVVFDGSQLQQNILEIQDLMIQCNDLSLDILGGTPVPPTPTQEYIELRYITGTGTQYINTNISASSIGKLTTKFKINNVVDYSAAMGVSGSSSYFGSNTTFGIGLTTRENQNGFWYCSKQNYSFSTNTLYDIEMSVANGNQTFKVNNTTYNTSFSGTPTSNKLYLFTMNYAGNVKTSEIAKIDLYRTKIYSNDKTTLLRDLIPCKRVSDNVICLYDKVSNTFFLNKGTGTFIAGPELGYTELEYIESSRTQFIDTGVSTNVNVGFEIDFQVMDTRREDAYFGARNSGVSPSRYGCMNYNGGFHMMLSGNAIWNYTVDTTRHKCSIMFNGNSYTAKFDNNQTTGTLSATDSGNFGLFGYNFPSRSEYPRSAMRLYSAKLYTNNTTLVRDFIPVKRKEDDVVCLYDKVSNTYYVNSGTGSFTAGPEKN